MGTRLPLHLTIPTKLYFPKLQRKLIYSIAPNLFQVPSPTPALPHRPTWCLSAPKPPQLRHEEKGDACAMNRRDSSLQLNGPEPGWGFPQTTVIPSSSNCCSWPQCLACPYVLFLSTTRNRVYNLMSTLFRTFSFQGDEFLAMFLRLFVSVNLICVLTKMVFALRISYSGWTGTHRAHQ